MNLKSIPIVLTLLLFSLSAKGQSDLKTKKITLEFEKKNIYEVLELIADKYDIAFAFARNLSNAKFSGKFENEPLTFVLDYLNEKTGSKYRIIQDQVTLFKGEDLELKTQNIKGVVYDFHSKVPLPGATILILDSNPQLGSITSNDGLFIIKDLHIGRYSLEVRFQGYQTRIIADQVLGAGKEIDLSIGLIEDVNQLSEVVVSGYKNQVVPINQMAVVSARSISAEETQRFAGSLSDPSRMALSYAGVNSSNGYSNEIIVRGNSPKGLLWMLEGIEIPNPNHYAVEGSSGGLINILNSNNMARSDFFVSAFPAEYGNANAGIFDLRMRNGNSDRKEHMVEASLLGLRASTEGPIGQNNGSYLVNYRYSTLGLVGNFAPNYDFPIFQDATFKFKLPTKSSGIFSIFGLGGLGKWDQESSVEFKDDNDIIISKSWHDIQKYDLGILGTSHAITLKNNKTYIETVLSLSSTQNRPSESDFDYQRFDTYLSEQGKYTNMAHRLASTINHKINASHLITTGLKANYLIYNLTQDSGLPNGQVKRELENNGSASLLQTFLSWQFKPSNNWVFNTGAHLTYFSLNDQVIVEPRFGIEHTLANNHTLSIGLGLHSRHESIATYFGENVSGNQVLYPNANLKLSRAAHFVFAYNATLAKNFHLKTEIYYQSLYDIPVENSINSSYSSINNDVSFTTRDLVNEGEGKNYGLELTLEKNFSNQYYFLVTGSLFDSKYKALDGIWRNSRYNTNYGFNLLGGKEFSIGKSEKNGTLGINLRGAITGGKRVTPIDLAASIAQGYAFEIESQAYSKKLSDYYRLDFSLYYKWETKNASHQIKLDILNLIEQNVYGIRYVPEKYGNPAKIKEYSFNEDDDVVSNIFPIIGYTIKFQ
jgi:hypothetical protein